MDEIRETELPGAGVRYDFTTAAGDPVGVLVHRTGRRELFVYSQDDPDACISTLRLDTQDARTLAELLGASRVTAQLVALQQDVAGLGIDWVDVESGSEWAGRSLADAGVHTKTGVSIVAIVRDGAAVPAPGPDAVMQVGDVCVAVGRPEGLTLLAEHLGQRRSA